MYRLGTISAVDHKTCRARVILPERGVETYWLEVLQRNTEMNHDYHLPDVGEMVAVLLDDNEEAGCILGAIYTDSHLPLNPNPNVRRVTFDDGTSVEYDRVEHRLRVVSTGPVVVECASAKVTADTVEVTAAVTITGDVVSTGSTHLDGVVTVAGGAEKVALAQKTANALTALKNAIAGGVPVPQDGGAALKSSIMSALAAWPPSIASGKLSSD